MVPDLVVLDHAVHPPLVRLVGSPTTAGGLGNVSEQGRLRADLWDAVLDYSSGLTYVWDGTQAVKLGAGDNADGPCLPTISTEVMAGWRRDFAEAHPDRDLSDWVDRGLGTVALPVDLRKVWNLKLKTEVHAILVNWFAEQDIQLPNDISTNPSSRPSLGDSQEAEELRRFLLRCVAVMKPSELRAMQVPVAVALRARM